MTQSQWQRAKKITADALEREPSTRPGFVENACSGDSEVQREVLRLLMEAERSGGFLSTPAFDIHHLLNPVPAGEPRFSAGQQLTNRFRIDRFLGLGGMGEVYAATDLELQQSVALKTIRPAIASSSDAIERFKREVKEARRITHSSVCRVYDLFSREEPPDNPLWFLTMELLEGNTLGDVLAARGPLPFSQAIPLIDDMVNALAAAHAMGVVHRDFKPGNIMLVKDDSGARERAVVMDFGLALNLSRDETSRAGMDGTPAYMSPEQAAGGKIGFAADQYALGLVTCELLTGSRPSLDFSSEAESGRQFNQWLKRQSRRNLNARSRRVLRRCLEFRPERRFRDVRDVARGLSGERLRGRLRWTAALAAVIAVLGAALAVSQAGAGLKVKDAVRVTPESGLSSASEISADGQWIVYSSDRAQSGNLDIYIQSVAGGPARRLTTNAAVEDDPTISSDGRLVAFHSERDGGGVFIVNADGTGERLLAAGGASPAFSPDGRSIAYWLGTRDDAAPSGQLYVTSPDGGQPRRLAADFADARYPAWDSSGHFLLFEGCRANTSALSTCLDWWVIRADGSGAQDTGAVALLKSQKIELTTPPKKVWRDDQVIFSGTRGEIAGLWTLSLSPDTLHPVGLPRLITPGDSGEREMGVGGNGSIVFVRITAALHIWRIPLQGGATHAAPVTDDPSIDGCPSVSRDGRWLYFTRRIHGTRQLLLRDISANRESVIFASNADAFWPVSSPDGDRAVFEVRDEKTSSIWLIERNGPARRLCTGCSHPTSWFAGDKAVFYTTAAGEIALLDVTTGIPRVVLSPQRGMVLGGADWHARNQHLLFTAVRLGAPKQAFAVRFPDTVAAPVGSWIELTSDAAEVDQPHWSVDGKALYFLSKRDGSNCVWGRPFPAAGTPAGLLFPVMHYHGLRIAPDRASPVTRGLTVTSDSIFLSVGEVYTAVWLGRLADSPLISLYRKVTFWR